MTSKKGKTFGIREIPYSERQLIVIVPDEVKEAEIKVIEEVQKSEEGKKLKYAAYLDKIADKLRPESVKERIRKNVRNDLLVQWGIKGGRG